MRRDKPDSNRKKIVEALRATGHIVIRVAVGEGADDIVINLRTRKISICEWKNLDGRGVRMTESEQDLRATLEAAGIPYHLITDWQEAILL